MKIFGYRLHSFQGRREKINFPLIRVFLQTQLNRHHEPPQTLADRKAVLTVTPVGLSWAGVWFLWPRRIPGACSFPTTSFPGLNLSVLKTKLRTVEPHEICHPGGTKRLRLWSSLPKPVHTHPKTHPQNPHPTLLGFHCVWKFCGFSETMLALLVVKANQLQNINLFLQKTVILCLQEQISTLPTAHSPCAHAHTLWWNVTQSHVSFLRMLPGEGGMLSGSACCSAGNPCPPTTSPMTDCAETSLSSSSAPTLHSNTWSYLPSWGTRPPKPRARGPMKAAADVKTEDPRFLILWFLKPSEPRFLHL